MLFHSLRLSKIDLTARQVALIKLLRHTYGGASMLTFDEIWAGVGKELKRTIDKDDLREELRKLADMKTLGNYNDGWWLKEHAG